MAHQVRAAYIFHLSLLQNRLSNCCDIFVAPSSGSHSPAQVFDVHVFDVQVFDVPDDHEGRGFEQLDLVKVSGFLEKFPSWWSGPKKLLCWFWVCLKDLKVLRLFVKSWKCIQLNSDQSQNKDLDSSERTCVQLFLPLFVLKNYKV